MGGPDAYLVIDDTALPKKGVTSVGVAPQYASALGKNANCQTLVSLTLARGEVPVPVALRLFLPEAWTGDPDVIGTLRYALENVTLLLWLLGDDQRPEIHGSRLAMMLEKTIDTTVRGVIYEAGPPEGVKTVEDVAGFNEIPHRIVPVDGDLRGAVDALLAR